MQLSEYAATKGGDARKRKRCLTCALDPEVLKQIHEARDAGKTKPLIAFPTISRWVEEETGRKIQPNTIRNHFVAGHHSD